MPIRQQGKIPDEAGRSRTLAEGDRFDVAELVDGRVQVIIDRGDGMVIHAGDAASVRVRILLDADPRDRGAIAAALGGRP